MIDQLDMNEVRGHYDERFACHQNLCRLLKANQTDDYLKLALGITKIVGNYSASDHSLGPRILESTQPERIVKLAKSLLAETEPKKMIKTVYDAGIANLKVSVGSEMAMMLKPDIFWVANVRTVWTHLLWKHDCNLNDVNFELKLYREERSSKLNYDLWQEIYCRMEPSISKVCAEGNAAAVKDRVVPGPLQYLWFDAIANSLYEKYTP